jgi:hypothetical protein
LADNKTIDHLKRTPPSKSFLVLSSKKNFFLERKKQRAFARLVLDNAIRVRYAELSQFWRGRFHARS